MKGIKPAIPKASLPGVPLPGWHSGQCRGEGKAGVLRGATLGTPVPRGRGGCGIPCCGHHPLPSPNPGQQQQPGSPSPAAQAGGGNSLIRAEAHVSLTLGFPSRFSTICLCLKPALWRRAGRVGSRAYPLCYTSVGSAVWGLLMSSEQSPSRCPLDRYPHGCCQARLEHTAMLSCANEQPGATLVNIETSSSPARPWYLCIHSQGTKPAPKPSKPTVLWALWWHGGAPAQITTLERWLEPKILYPGCMGTGLLA